VVSNYEANGTQATTRSGC